MAETENGESPPRAECKCGRRHERLKINVDGVVAHVLGCPDCLSPGTEERDALEVLIRDHAEEMRKASDPTYVRWQIVHQGEAMYSPVHLVKEDGVAHCGEEIPSRAFEVEDTKLVRKRPCRAGCFHLGEDEEAEG